MSRRSIKFDVKKINKSSKIRSKIRRSKIRKKIKKRSKIRNYLTYMI